MGFGEFERLVLRVLFETSLPVTAPHLAYLGSISVKLAERHLARMVEEGALAVRCNDEGAVEYYLPGARDHGLTADGEAEGADATSRLPALLQPSSNPLTSVMLSILIPGAGHIYAGRPAAGVAWMTSTIVGYTYWFLPGLFLHGLCLVSAAHTRQNG